MKINYINFLYALLLESNQSLVTSVDDCGHWNQRVVISSDPRVYKYNSTLGSLQYVPVIIINSKAIFSKNKCQYLILFYCTATDFNSLHAL